MDGLELLASSVIPFLVGLLKKISWIGKKGAPVSAVICGIAFALVTDAFGMIDPDPTTIEAIWSGIKIGGLATGLYAIAKKSPTTK